MCSIRWQQCIEVTLCWLPAGSEAFVVMQEQVSFPAIAVVVKLVGPGIRRCWGWVPDFVQKLYSCGIVIEIAGIYCGLLPLDYCQWMVQQRLMEGNIEVMLAVHTVVLLAILQS